ncbi:DUF3302 domain-containing protein [Desulfogranum japonicum]|uniref:DUF3302 domain-containing protein n=1 Tax=Desulfogranum japonicum TaxID=231447 RepID=UPI000A03848E
MLDFIALAVLCFVVLTIIYGIIFIHDIPYNIAKKRQHPHQDAIHTAGWVSLFLMHAIWPLLWIWATLYKPGYGWGLHSGKETETEQPSEHSTIMLVELTERIARLEEEKKHMQSHYNRLIKQLHGRITKLESGQTAEEEL